MYRLPLSSICRKILSNSAACLLLTTAALAQTCSYPVVTNPMDLFVESAGDFNGDGLGDLLLASNGALRVYTWAGTDWSSSPVFLTTLYSGNNLSVTSLRDVNGDGRDELAVGVPTATVGGLIEAGRVDLLAGGTGALLASWSGNVAQARFGANVANAGDLDQDGYDDLLVGAPGGIPTGYVEVFSGLTWASLGTFQIPGANLGWRVAPAKDVNGDGTVDFLAAANSGCCNNRVRIYSGASMSVAFGTLLHEFLLSTAGSNELGQSSIGIGDTNGDGFGEVAIAGTTSLNIYSGQDIALAGVFGPVNPMYTYASPTYRFGEITAPGDVTGDGTPDLVCGQNGAGVGLPNQPRGLIVNGDGFACDLTTLLGPGSINLVGEAAALGDVDGDGLPDFTVTPKTFLGVGNGPAATYPGSNQPLGLTTAVSLTGSLSAQPDVKSLLAPDYVFLNIASGSTGTWGTPLILAVQSFTTPLTPCLPPSAPAVPGCPFSASTVLPFWIAGGPIYFLQDGLVGGLLPAVLLPSGNTYGYLVPQSLVGQSLLFQAAVVLNSGQIWLTHAHQVNVL